MNLPKVIVSDNSLPKITGIQFFENLRQIEAYKNIPFVLLSTHLHPLEVEKITALKHVQYFVKQILLKAFFQSSYK